MPSFRLPRLLRTASFRFTALYVALFAGSSAVRTKGSYYRDKYNRLRARRSAMRAIMAVAHKLLIAAFHMLGTVEVFRDLGGS